MRSTETQSTIERLGELLDNLGTIFLFWGEGSADCTPIVLDNLLTACANVNALGIPVGALNCSQSLIFTPHFGASSGGTATIEFDCCAENPATAWFAATNQSTSTIRHCCEVYKVTLAGGTELDGVYKLVKRAIQSPGRATWGCNKFPLTVATLGYVASPSGRWRLIIDKSILGEAFSHHIIYEQAQGDGNICPMNTPWTLLENFIGGTPVLTVERSNCWNQT